MNSEEQRNLKDFLMLHHSITEKCFRKCVPQLYSGKLSSAEISCAERCAERFVKSNQRSMKIFFEYQTQKQQAQVAEMQKQGQTNSEQTTPSTQGNNQVPPVPAT